jgi:hypothetical protein
VPPSTLGVTDSNLATGAEIQICLFEGSPVPCQ